MKTGYLSKFFLLKFIMRAFDSKIVLLWRASTNKPALYNFFSSKRWVSSAIIITGVLGTSWVQLAAIISLKSYILSITSTPWHSGGALKMLFTFILIRGPPITFSAAFTWHSRRSEPVNPTILNEQVSTL